MPETITQFYIKRQGPYEKALSGIKEVIEATLKDNVLFIEKRVKPFERLRQKCTENNLHPGEVKDLLGLRIIYKEKTELKELVSIITHSFPEITILGYRDYNKETKNNGYIAYHIYSELTVNDEKAGLQEQVKLEIQLRTLPQHIWAQIEVEHRSSTDVVLELLQKLGKTCQEADDVITAINHLYQTETPESKAAANDSAALAVAEYLIYQRENLENAKKMVARILESALAQDTYFIEGRVKSYDSLREKCERKGVDVERIPEEINDLVGIRVVDKYYDRIEKTVQKIKDLPQFIQRLDKSREKNYNKNPKGSGYSGYHLGCKYSVPTPAGHKIIPVEIQVRTAGQHLWCTTDQLYRYKKLPADKKLQTEADELFNKLKEVCNEIDRLSIEIRDLSGETKIAQKKAAP